MTRPATKKDFAAVKLLILDVDGVLTDGGVSIGPRGEHYKRFFIPDGMGMVVLQRAGIPIAVMTTTEDDVAVRSRMEHLDVRMYRPGILHKGEHLPLLLKEAGVNAKNVAYLADDINDVVALRQVGLPIATPDALPQVMRLARYVTKARGGQGAVREVCDRILAAKKLDPVELWECG